MREQRRISVRERELASTQLAQRTIRSPFDGVIVERYGGARANASRPSRCCASRRSTR